MESDILATATVGLPESYGRAFKRGTLQKVRALDVSRAYQGFGLNDAYVALAPRPPHVIVRNSLQSCVLCLSLFKDRDFGVGVFPQGEEILIGYLV